MKIHTVQSVPTHSCATITPVFALAWHGTASLFGYFRPDQAPPTFILITSWFAPGFCSPSFFPSERFPTVDAWEPHLCSLVYSCSRFATRVLVHIYVCIIFFLPLLHLLVTTVEGYTIARCFLDTFTMTYGAPLSVDSTLSSPICNCRVAELQVTSCTFDVVDRFRYSYDSNESIGNAFDNVYKRDMDTDVSFGVSLSVNSPVVYNASLRHRRRGVVVRYFTNRPRRVLDGSRGVEKKGRKKERKKSRKK